MKVDKIHKVAKGKAIINFLLNNPNYSAWGFKGSKEERIQVKAREINSDTWYIVSRLEQEEMELVEVDMVGTDSELNTYLTTGLL